MNFLKKINSNIPNRHLNRHVKRCTKSTFYKFNIKTVTKKSECIPFN